MFSNGSFTSSASASRSQKSSKPGLRNTALFTNCQPLLSSRLAWLVLSFLLLSVSAHAQLTSGPFTYSVDASGSSVTIVAYSGTGGAVTIPDTINSLPVDGIGTFAFESGTAITSIVISSSVTTIADDAFYGCSGLTSVTIPSGVTTLGNYVFDGCSNVTTISIPSTLATIGNEGLGVCNKLTSIAVSSSNAAFSSVSGVLFDEAQDTLIQYPGGLSGSYTIPSTVTTIAQFAFYDCALLTSVTIPSSVTSIGTDAFYGCSNLVSAIFLGNAPSMDPAAFTAAAASFKVYYSDGSTGFTTPKWDGYPSVDTPIILSAATVSGTDYLPLTYQISASQNASSFSSSALPTGLILNASNGLISGTPSVTGTFPVTINAVATGGTASASLTFVLVPEPMPTISSSLSVTGTDLVPFAYQIAAAPSPTSYSASGLPTGLNFSTVTGLISGTPTQTGTFPVSIGAVNFGGTNSRTLSLVIALPPIPVITSALTATGSEGSAFTYQITASYAPTSFIANNLPGGLTLTASTGLISGTLTVDGTFAATIGAVNLGGTGTATLNLNIAPPPLPKITSAVNATGTNGYPFTYQITATNNPSSFNATGLPTGLQLVPASGLIFGTPTQTGTFPVMLTATNVWGTGTSSLALVIAPSPIPAITSPLVATGTGSLPFAYQITTSLASTQFGAIGLPQGLAISSSTGLISGIPTVSGSFVAAISAVGSGGTASAGLTFLLAPGPLPVITSTLSASGTNGFPLTYQITATNNPTAFSATGLPTGLNIAPSTGAITGTPSQSGTFSVLLGAINTGGTGTGTLSLVVAPRLIPVVTSPLTITATNGFPFSYQITATNNPTAYTATGLPSGLNFFPSTGLITGTPTVTGTFSVIIGGTNVWGPGSSPLSLTVAPTPPPSITSLLTASGKLGVPFSYQITAIDLPASYGASNLPPGLAVNTSSGVISGTPTATGTFASTISAINVGGTDNENFTVTIVPPAPVITSGSTGTGTTSTAFNYQITATNNPNSYGATGLPAGLALNTSSGLISGTPAASGTFSVKITATNGGGTGSGKLILTVTTDFTKLVGSYDGLGAVGGTDSALFTVSVTDNGSFTAKLAVANASYPFKGTFTTYGAFTGGFSIGGAFLYVSLTTDPSLPAVTGSINVETTTSANTYTVDSLLLGKFTATTLPAGLAGNYTVVFPAVSGTDPAVPHAPGYGKLSVSTTGALHLTGKLGDGTALSARSQLHADKQTWSLFEPLYKGKAPGSIAGLITFENLANSDADGGVDWIKPAQSTGAFYPAGFTGAIDFVAAHYKAPPFTSGTAAIIIGGGDLANSAVTSALSISVNSKVIVTGSQGVTITLTPATGAFTGSFKYPVTDKKTTFGGVIYQKPASAGYGLFMGTDQTGSVQVTRSAPPF
jgi:hypothetical protein